MARNAGGPAASAFETSVSGAAPARDAGQDRGPAERIAFESAEVAGVRLFYREAGDPSKPTIVLLHGFPSSSFQFHDLIPRLADRFHVIAPDLPGMGYSDAPAPTVLRPTFDDLARVIDAFIAQRGAGPVILYLYDIGGSIGMRVATAHPERIAGLVLQNMTISLNGRAPATLKFYEQVGGPETPDKLAEAERRATMERDIFLSLGAKRPDLHARGPGRPEAGSAGSRAALFRRRPLRARRIRRRVRRGDHRYVFPLRPSSGHTRSGRHPPAARAHRLGI